MKKIFTAALLVFCALHRCAYADFYRASGGGVYELYVNDCSETNMRRVLDRAVADKRAVITTVKCAANTPYDARTDIIVEYEWESFDCLDICQCAPIQLCVC